MLLGFKSQFVPYVLDGTKTHTIRAMRRNPPRVGEICHCYAGLRTKQCALLGRWECSGVQEAEITMGLISLVIAIDGELLSQDEADRFAWRDGFRAPNMTGKNEVRKNWIDCGVWLEQMTKFWKEQHHMQVGDLFVGPLIHWKYSA